MSSISVSLRILLPGVSFLLLAGLTLLPVRAADPVPDTTILSALERLRADLLLADGASSNARLDGDGEGAVFQSAAANLIPLDPDDVVDVYHRGGTRIELVSQHTDGTKGNGRSHQASIDAAGEGVAFTSEASNLVDRDRNDVSDVLYRDLDVGRTILISEGSSALSSSGNGPSDQPEISRDGDWIVFRSRAGDLLSPVGQVPDATKFFHLFIHQISSSRTLRPLPVDREGNPIPLDGDVRWPDVSDDGDQVVFETDATIFFPRDTNDAPDVVLFDNQAKSFTLIGLDETGEAFSGGSRRPRINAAGTHVAFEGTGTDGISRVYVRPVLRGSSTLVSVDDAGDPASRPSFLGELSADGLRVVFASESALSPLDREVGLDIYRHDLATGFTQLISLSPRDRLATGATFPVDTWPASLSDDGSRVGLGTISERLVPAGQVDDNDLADVYRVELLEAPAPLLPPSDKLAFFRESGGASRLEQVSPDGSPGRFLELVGSPEALAHDELNTLWLVDGGHLSRYGRLRMDELLDRRDLPGTGPVQALIASRDRAWIARDDVVHLLNAEAESIATPFARQAGPALQTRLALGGPDDLWVVARLPDAFRVHRLDADLRIRSRFDLDLDDRPRDADFDCALGPDLSLYLRTSSDLARFTASGAMVWRRVLEPGGGLAVDHRGRAHVVAGTRVLRFEPSGLRTVAVDLVEVGFLAAAPAGTLPSQVSLTAESTLAVLVEGEDDILFLDPATGQALNRASFPGSLLSPTDPSGYASLSLVDPEGDPDGDTYGSLDELEDGENPLDPTPPDRRLPPVIELTGEAQGRDVELSWRSPLEYCSLEVYRDGQLLDGDVTVCGEETLCYVDPDLPGGVYLYQVRGIDDCRGGGGGKRLRDKGPAPGQVSDFEEFLVVVGEQGAPGACFLDLPEGLDPTAVAIAPDGQSALVVQETGLLHRLSLPSEIAPVFGLQSTVELPADPFAEVTVTGCALDPASPDTRAYLLTEDGEIHALDPETGASLDPVIDLTDFPELMREDLDQVNYSGLVALGETLYTLQSARSPLLIGPGVDCLIGYQGGGIITMQILGGPQGAFPGRHPARVDGLALLDSDPTSPDFLVGLGSDSNTIEHVFDLGATILPDGEHQFTPGRAGVDLAALGASRILDLAYAPDRGELLVSSQDELARNRLCLVAATFPPGPVPTLSTGAVAWDATNTLTVSLDYTGTGTTFDQTPVELRLDGIVPVETAPADVSPDGLQVQLEFEIPPNVAPARRMLSIHSDLGIAARDLVQGFRRGDVDSTGVVDLGDCLSLLFHLFGGGPGVDLPCEDALDVDDSVDADGQTQIDLTDVVMLLRHLFLNEMAPRDPFAEFGLDSTVDSTGCGEDF